MKILILSLLLFTTSLSVNAQFKEFDFDITKATQVGSKVTYTLIDTVNSVKKDKIHSLLLEWVALNFKSATNVIKLDDRSAGKIIVKGLNKASYAIRILGTDALVPYDQRFMLDISVKDNKYRVIITDFEVDIAATYSRYGGSPAVSNSVESYYANVPVNYNYEKLKRNEQKMLNISKEVFKNTFDESIVIIESIKSFMKNNSNDSLKSEDSNF